MRNPKAQFCTNGFVENPYSTIGMATAAGMGLMFMGIMTGLHVYICMALLFGGILLVFGFSIATIKYEIFDDGITQQIRRKIPYQLWKKEENRTINWHEVKSYKIDFDKNRSGKEYEYIKLYLKKSPGQIWITDQINRTGFVEFKEVFLQIIEKHEPQKPTATPQTERAVQPPQLKAEHIVIERKSSFYDTFFAKIVTVFFLILTAILLAIGFIHGFSGTQWWKVNIILLPGTIYMMRRVFFAK
ncbi:MAG: hypothetical protein H6607_02305 [Flavobacteriales bacterium]|nr:hypothetical protein [Flavobacteriales bacterium]